MTTDPTLPDIDDTAEILARIDRVTVNATARARVVQAEIDRLRRLLRSSRRSNPNARLLLASYDAEMERLHAVYGVTRALYDDAPEPI